MSVYPLSAAAPGAHSPHSGFVPPGAQAAPGVNASVYNSNSVPFSAPYGGPSRQTGYSHLQQYAAASASPQPYQQLGSYATADVHAPANAVGTAAASQPHKHPAAASFQAAMQPPSSSVQGALQSAAAPSQQQQQQQQQEQQTAAAEEEAMACTQEIAHAFVYQYYLMLHEAPGDIYRFYDQDSKMLRGSDRAYFDESAGCQPEDYCVRAVGLQRIMHAFQRLEFNKATCRILNIDAQEVHNGGILILVTGCLKHSEDKPEREFVQTVLLAKMRPPRAGWYVHTEMFIYLDSMVSAAGAKAIAEARKQQQELQQQQQLEQQREQQQPLEHQRKQLERQQQQQSGHQRQQEQLTQQQQQAGDVAHEEQQQAGKPREGTLNVYAKKDGRLGSPAGGRGASEGKQSRAADARQAPEQTPQQQPAAQDHDRQQQQHQQQSEGAAADSASRQAKPAERARSKWPKQEAPEGREEPSPHWPKPGQLPDKPAAEKEPSKGAAAARQQQQQQQQHNYDPQSFAFKVLQNARPVGQKGFAVPANLSGSSDSPPSSRQEGREGEEASRGAGRGSGSAASHSDSQQQPQQQQLQNRRLIILTELPPPISVEEIKSSVADRLASFNRGECVDVRKPAGGRTFGVVIELDSTQSAQHLVEGGLVLSGRQVRIDFVRPRGPSGGGGRGGRGPLGQRGPWEERRTPGENRRANRAAGGGGGGGGAESGGGQQQERPPAADEADEEGQGQWINPAARRRPRPPRGGGGGPAFSGNGGGGAGRGRGGGGGAYRANNQRTAQE